jgi:mannose-1-phosphate guanylyltransferase/phosphomannomutase
MLSVIILCGGKNSRIQKYNKKIIKPLIVYKKLTLLEHHLQKIQEIKKKNVFINLHKNIKKFTTLKKKKKLNFNIIYEKSILGTGGVVISNIKKFNNDILVLYGDNYINYNIKNFINFFNKKKIDLLIGAYLKKDLSQSGLIKFSPSKKILKIEEKNSLNKNMTGFCNGGIYLFKKHILNQFKKNKFLDFASDIFPKILSKYDCCAYRINYCKSFDTEYLYKKNLIISKTRSNVSN